MPHLRSRNPFDQLNLQLESESERIFDDLERVALEGPDENRNPFDRMTLFPGKRDAEISPEVFNELFSATEGFTTVEERPGLGEIARGGFVEGLLDPLTIFGREGSEFDPEGFAENAAQILGELVGFGVALVPIGKGVSLVGGRLARAGLGKGLSLPMKQALTSGATFAVFEAGTAEGIKEIPEKVAIGFTIGAGGDAILRRVAKNWRKTGPEPTIEDVFRMGKAADLANEEVARRAKAAFGIEFDPRKLAVENVLPPEAFKSVSNMLKALDDVVEGTVSLDMVAAQLAIERLPGGVGILPSASKDAAEFLVKMQRFYPEGTQIIQRDLEGGFTELLVNTAEEVSEVVMETITRRLPKRLNAVQAVKLVREGRIRIGLGGKVVIDEGVVVNLDFTRKQLPGQLRMVTTEESLDGFYRYQPPPSASIIFLGKDAPAWQKLETIAHEYTHHLTRGVVGSKSVTRLDSSGEMIGEVFSPFFAKIPKSGTIAEFEAAQLGEKLPGRVRILTTTEEGVVKAAKEAQVAQIRVEMEEATKWLLKFQNKGSLTQAVEIFEKDIKYFGRDIELMARMVELMWVDPVLAARVAPRATRAMSKLIHRNSPVLEELVGDRQVHNLSKYLKQNFKLETETIGTRMEKIKRRLSEADIRNYQETGFFPRLGVTINGKEAFVEKVITVAEKPTRLLLRYASSGKPVKVGGSRIIDTSKIVVHRPVFPRIVAENQFTRRTLKEIIANPTERLNWVGFSILDPQTKTVHRAILRLGQNIERTSDIAKWKADHRIADKLKAARKNQSKITEDEVIARELVSIEKEAMLANDEGITRVFFTKRTGQVEHSSSLIPDEIIGPADYTLGELSFELSFDSSSKSVLRGFGLNERMLPVVQEDFLVVYREHLLNNVVDAETKQAFEAAVKGFEEAAGDVSAVAARSGLQAEKLSSGVIATTEAETGAVIGTGAEGLSKSISNLHEPLSKEILPGLGLPTEVVGASAGGTPSRGAQQAATGTLRFAKIDEFFESFRREGEVFFSRITAMENFTKSVEEGLLKQGETVRPWRDVFRPLQLAMTAVNNSFALTKHAALGDVTFNTFIRDMSTKARGMKKDAREKVTELVEYLSREEIAAPGGLLERGMTATELKLSKTIVDAGMVEQMPKLIALSNVINGFLKGTGRKELLERMITNTERAPKEAREVYNTLRKALQDVPDSGFQDLVSYLGLPQEEELFLKLIEIAGKEGTKDTFSIMAVTRHAMARPLGKGFKTGREQFIAENGLSSIQVSIANDIDKLMAVAFEGSGIDPKRMLGGYWPHMRVMGRRGLRPEHFDDIPEGIKWAAQRFRTGELSLYEVDPILGSLKHVRNMLKAKQLDPIMKDVKKALNEIKQVDERTGRYLDEYLNEITGVPHESFARLQQIFDRVAVAIGKPGRLDPDTARKVVNTLTGLVYGATIPFRAALIARNYFQMLQMIPPRIGWKYFQAGLRQAVNKEGPAFQEAVAAGAVPPNVLPVFGSTSIWETGDLLGQATSRFGEVYQTIFDRGFRWYKQADDVARAAAYHGQRARLRDAVSRMKKGEINFEKMMQEGKVTTYRESDQLFFRELMAENKYEEAIEHISVTLARETIFRYGQANHPAGWGSVYGRLFGQFGTWPVQYKDFLAQGLTRGTTKDRAEFLFNHAAVNLAVVGTGDAMGLDLFSWVAWPSLSYTGGPFASMTLDGIQVISGSPQERAMALKSLAYQVPTLSDPSSIFLPGSYAAADALEGFQKGDNLAEMLLWGTGFRLNEPGRTTGFDRATGGLFE